MSKQQKEVQLLMDDRRRLSIRTADGQEYRLSIYNGGGYYTDFMLQTDEEVAKAKADREAYEKRAAADMQARTEAQNTKPWWKFWL